MVAKHRNGSVKDIKLCFMPEYTTFYDWTDDMETSYQSDRDEGDGGDFGPMDWG